MDIYDWMDGFIDDVHKHNRKINIDPDLLDYNDFVISFTMKYPCRVCGEPSDIFCEPEEFDPDNHWCGGSPRCCP